MKVCGVDLGSVNDTVFFEGQVWEGSHDVSGWFALDERLPEDCEVVFEGRCAALEAVLGHRPLYSLEPGRSAQVRRALEEAKDDARDAETLAQLRQLRPRLFQPIRPRDPQLQHLRDLSRARRGLVEHRTTVLQQLQAVRRRGKEREKEWLRGFQGTPEEGLVCVLEVLRQEITRLESQIQQAGEKNPTCMWLRTIQGMGSTLSAEITGEMDEFTPFQRPSEAQAYGGTAPVTLASGNRKWVKLRRRCNHRARNALYLFAFCSLRFHPWARQYYDAARARGKTHSTALLALANRWVPILMAMIRKEDDYDPTRKHYRSPSLA